MLSDYQGPYVRRPTLVVRDMHEALKVYRDILGFRLAYKPKPPAGYDVYEIFNIPLGTPLLFVPLDSDRKEGAMALLASPLMKPLDHERNGISSALVLDVGSRLSKIMVDVERAGYKTLAPHALPGGGTEAGFFDRDGHLIVIFDNTVFNGQPQTERK